MHYSNQAKTAQLNKRITFQKMVVTTDKYDNEIKKLQDYKTVWAAAKNLHGQEFYAAGEEQSKRTAIFTIRYTNDISNDMRIKFGDRSFNISFVDDIKYQGEFMEVTAIEIVQEGD
ncbi:SPP1 family predicted phage head-tail adaptor [Clostridium acetobutylicum]|uniref:Uncharacterized phage related protein n=1 Tax=Clostridium acetobutylicum (strain ATCC 824 / DSM 792 / JCM 1419 / IAM 19013 / LMG 5710 / NBRC 13948 / NRRL B-527 / VKM B-1787 / 2291 / W) TaxID=272562 RepID=Q97HW7_CLOAB|nr:MULTISPECIES: phage head closure protein [Clostridium]AAK79853.1 Uncharacterized phage related protein [Clostridium acetobutylicum ATCC 824]ADZ20939.1 Conserved hypothetical protein [Clostridium acetobutylicum EA 2018]AEI32029.1 phage related protein [Clostridium acetobutylicum DSM 1731]AWV79717.1 head-tail adaptor protein [Clostridium acetobutylicum]MBC2394305.1 phage head closure protein [Clostridium acetobutylicum]